MNITFNGKVAMVTGAASGIGLACAEMLAGSGAKTALVDMNEKALSDAVAVVEKKGIAKGYLLDVTNVPQIDAVVERIRKEMGEIDVLVCSAGIGPSRRAEDITESEWDSVFAVNDKGLFFCNRAVAVQSMIPRKTGAIVNLASIAALVGGPPPTCSAHYHASKGGVVSLTRAEAVEWASHNVRVNAIAPTVVETPLVKQFLDVPEVKEMALSLIPLRRVAQPEDIAAAACFLASDCANMITGVVLPVDGGHTAA